MMKTLILLYHYCEFLTKWQSQLLLGMPIIVFYSQHAEETRRSTMADELNSSLYRYNDITLGERGYSRIIILDRYRGWGCFF